MVTMCITSLRNHVATKMVTPVENSDKGKAHLDL